ncbi:D-alanine--D-alanine ligase [Campylobacter sp. MIT 21-1685]|uniref:D-alanine--D-alanine ligase n=1 Tax=unclassified Campylobacter TaxID=2593542 RepID=UPI00224A5BF0|nr:MULTISPECIES: D-alanine--D-alanine ligase [unclassified Campylobacter]MCX2683599.1 D-alanine--D-alanine ligase [Campylobacter sp. MIT 21-1684]MCX2751882.1 D-alanine--D-alanine ligase [Campylobacter sp. MIT 21-1682]MCX2808065.1 D-alanine--D-alanine ligase [Campylobacter sp. MIT 21-1685]
MKYGVLFGGNSYEHEISIISAVVLKKVLKADLEFIFCDSERNFYHIPNEKFNATIFSSLAYKKEKKLFLKHNGFFYKSFLKEKKLECSCIINLIHGKDGEDGKIASLLEFYAIRFIGPRLEASVLSFNKELTKLYAKNIGVKTLDYTMLTKDTKQEQSLKFPCIIKPARLGSSIGISIVHNKKELDYAKDVGFEFDTDLLVEEFQSNIKEYNLAGCIIGDEFFFSRIEEPKKKEFLDFEQKYLSFSGSTNFIEADLSEDLKNKLRQNFKKIYEPLFRGALIRCDFFLKDDEIYLNEINPNPGSLANYLFEDFNEIIAKLAKSVENEKTINITYTFLHSLKGQKSKL